MGHSLLYCPPFIHTWKPPPCK